MRDVVMNDTFCWGDERVASVHEFVRDRERRGKRMRDGEGQMQEWAEGVTLEGLTWGDYVALDRNAGLVRSTISLAFSADGKLFASTHGDHSVKIFSYPDGTQMRSLEGHPRTPWTVQFHPQDSTYLASGCLGYECRIWNVETGACLRKYKFGASISCVSFHPDGDILAITSGRKLLFWEFGPLSARQDTLPLEDVHPAANPYHMVAFHPSGSYIMTGEKNDASEQGTVEGVQDSQFTLKLEIRRFQRSIARLSRTTGPFELGEIILRVRRAVAYNDAGVHFSPCGRMLVACIPTPENPMKYHIAVMSLFAIAPNQPAGTILFSGPIDQGRVHGLTNLKFSSTSSHILAGFSFRRSNQVIAEIFASAVGNTRPQVRVVDIYSLKKDLNVIHSLTAEVSLEGVEDEINIAGFAPGFGVSDGIVYGTQKGRIRMFHGTSHEAYFMTLAEYCAKQRSIQASLNDQESNRAGRLE
uniref:Anaphase-promoting complex subunit 4 WD40 domain-containing protein n=1 Tax=Compsopogon caeruleus TaxID=31354 RepID=A0A7S1XEV4_9RHOD|mmetsp:Transcript_4565/g.9117  ORF Transcript_4565/g.9117 Transcript_4565/m.9117 type:complete len:471 (+) Transcript_4565:42-1454(+)